MVVIESNVMADYMQVLQSISKDNASAVTRMVGELIKCIKVGDDRIRVLTNRLEVLENKDEEWIDGMYRKTTEEVRPDDY